MKAWAVATYQDWEEGVDFVWCDTRGQARAHGAFFFGDDWVNIRAVRVPLLDGDGAYPTDSLIVQAGYGGRCKGCDRNVYRDSGESYAPDGGVYCEDCTIGACAIWIRGAGVEPGAEGPHEPVLIALGMAAEAPAA